MEILGLYVGTHFKNGADEKKLPNAGEESKAKCTQTSGEPQGPQEESMGVPYGRAYNN